MHPREERVAALYARVVRRVCERFELQLDAGDGSQEGDEGQALARRRDTARRIEQQWRERLTRYTGCAYPAPAATDQGGEVERLLPPRSDATILDEPERDLAAPSLAPPQALLELRPPSSIFATMLTGKRKIDQLDGSVDEESDDGPRQPISEQPAHPGSPFPRAASPSSAAVATEDVGRSAIAPTTALNGFDFPLQCSACDVNFSFKKDALRGKWKGVVLTMLRRVVPGDELAPKHVLWVTRDIGTVTSEKRGGTVVEVVDAEGDDWILVRVAASGQTHRVHLDEIRRFTEVFVASCIAHLRFNRI